MVQHSLRRVLSSHLRLNIPIKEYAAALKYRLCHNVGGGFSSAVAAWGVDSFGLEANGVWGLSGDAK
jgi:hypothetical protein